MLTSGLPTQLGKNTVQEGYSFLHFDREVDTRYIFNVFYSFSIYCVSALSQHIESTDSMITLNLWWLTEETDLSGLTA